MSCDFEKGGVIMTKIEYINRLEVKNKLNGIYRKILSELNVDNFGYLKIYKNNCGYFYLNSDDEVSKQYIENVDTSNVFFKEFLDKKHLFNKDFYYILWPKVPLNLSMDIYIKNNYWNGLSILAQNEDSLEIWWVATNPNNERITDLYSQESFRRRFLILVDYFNKHLNQILSVSNVQIIMGKYDKFDFSLSYKEIDQRLAEEYVKRELLIRKLYPKGILIQSRGNRIVKLTPIQIKILGLLSLNYQAQEISRVLGNASKTVEHHKAAIRNKTGYSLTSDLVELYNQQIKFLIE